jgi:hypothetical protein
VRPIDIQQRNPELLDVQLQWLTRKTLTRNYNYSLRLVDDNGVEIAQFDSQPGYGFLPSSSWRPDSWIDDWLALPLPLDFPSTNLDSPYSLVIRLYEVDSGDVVLIRRLGELEWHNENLKKIESRPLFTLPSIVHTASVTFQEKIRLTGYDHLQPDDTLTLDLYWQTLITEHEDYYHFVHLIDPDSGEIVAQHDSMPRNDTYPTSQWSEREVVLDSVKMDLELVPAGRYLIAVGLYRDLGTGDGGSRFQRLVAIDDESGRLPDDRYFLTSDLIVD